MFTSSIDSAGYWTGYLTGAADQAYNYTGTVTDLAGNVGTHAGTSISFTIDTTAPAAPQINAPTSGSYSTTGNVTISGTGEVGGTFRVYSGGVEVASGTVDASGYWTGYLTGLADQQYTLTGTVTDVAGNVSSAGTAVSFIVDTVAPNTPVMLAPSNNQYFSSGGVLAIGTAEANSTFTISSGGTVLVTGTVDSAGYWTGTMTNLNHQGYTISVTATDAAGNVSTATTAVTFYVRPNVAISIDTGSIAEASGQAIITATATEVTPSQTIIVGLSFAGTTMAGADYVVSSGQIMITAGNTTGSMTITAFQDTILEATESIDVTMVSVTNATTGTTTNVSTNIIDDDAVSVSLSVDTTTAVEASGAVSVIATLTGGTSATDVTVTLSTGGLASAGDYVLSSNTITVSAGNTTGAVTLTAFQDTLIEWTEDVDLSIGATSGATATGSAVSVNITDDDPIYINVGGTTGFYETGDMTTVTFTTSGAITAEYAFNVNVVFTGDANGTPGLTDYTGDVTSVYFSTGATGVNVGLTALDDYYYEQTETFTVSVSSITELTGGAGSDGSRVFSIFDDETVPVVHISGGATMSENGSGALVEVFLSGGLATGESYVALTYSGVPIAGSDYSGFTGYVTIPPLTTGVYFSITGIADTLVEGTEAEIIEVTLVS